MIISKKRFALLYLILLFLSIYTPKYGAIDRMSIQFLLLSVTNFLAFISIPLIFKIEKSSLRYLFKNNLLIAYFGVILISLLSIIKSINVVESLVRFNQLTVFFLSLIILIFFAKENLIKVRSILWIILISLVIDISFSLYPFTELLSNNLKYSYKMVTNFVGLSGNRNILALSILFRVPFLIYFAYTCTSKRLKYLIFIVLVLSFFNIYILSSRAALLGVILSIVFPLFLILLKNSNNLKNQIRHLVVFLILPITISLIISSNVIAKSDEAKVGSRISSIITDNDTSINSRYRYWSHALDFIYKNPLLGSGIGNWKIYSIKYDAPYIKSYIIPYSVHNDFLEHAAETGIIGGTIFLSFFVILFIYILKTIKIKKNDFDFMLAYTLLFPFLVYFLDLNLNFPSSRPLNLFLLLLLILLVKINLNKKHEDI